MNDEISGEIDNKNVKFSNDKIEELFDLLQKKTKQYDFSPITKDTIWRYPSTYVNGKYQDTYDVDRKEYMKRLKEKGKITSTDINARMKFDAGDSYDKHTSEERVKMCQDRAANILATINSTLSSSADPLFSRLQAEIKNTKIDYCYKRKDPTDDGWDLFCCELWLKIYYAK